MRSDMAKVVTERPRRGHGNPSKKWGRRLRKSEYDAEDHGSSRAPIARRHQYGWNSKEFSDLLGPLRRYLHKQVARPWDKVWSEITRNLDSRSLSGQHIFDHIQWEVEQHAWLGPDGTLHRNRWSGLLPVSGLYVHGRRQHLRRREGPALSGWYVRGAGRGVSCARVPCGITAPVRCVLHLLQA
jgi:hypothetical protein